MDMRSLTLALLATGASLSTMIAAGTQAHASVSAGATKHASVSAGATTHASIPADGSTKASIPWNDASTAWASSVQYPADSVFHTESGLAQFTSVAPMLEFTGTSNHLTGLIDLRRNTLDFYLDLETIDTGIRLRNKHMRDSYLETATYPFAEFKGRLASVPQLTPGKPVQVRAVGRFSLHGVDRDIEVVGTLALRDGSLHLDAGWDLLLGDYRIDVPKVVFYELSEVQKIRISGVFSPHTTPK